MSDRRKRATGGGQRTWLGYLLVVVGVVLASIGGYIGYVLYPRFDLPGVTVSGLFALAAGAGVASFFSPCSFPLLLSLFGRTPGATDRRQEFGWRRSLLFAIGLSIGATAFLLLAGTVVALFGARIFERVVFTSTEGIILRSAVGLVLIVLGLTQMRLLPLPVPPIQDLAEPLTDSVIADGDRSGMMKVSLFGFGYLAAGFG